MAPQKALTILLETQEKAKGFGEHWIRLVLDHPALFDRLDQLEIEYRFDLSDGCVLIIFDGDTKRFQNVWKALRTAGFKTGMFPRAGESAFSAFWDKRTSEGRYCSIWIHFTSSVCKTIKVGTKMVEQPVYEVQCGEPIVAPEEASALAELGV